MTKYDSWYPIRVTFGRVLKLQNQFVKRKVKCFVPLVKKTKLVNEKLVTQLVPAISNYIFVYSNVNQLYTIKEEVESVIPFRFILDPKTKLPISIPKTEMDNFITVSETQNEQLIYLKPNELNFKKGDFVKIIDGPFKGVEGKFIRIKGDRRLVVCIEGIMAVATTFIHPSLIVPIQKSI
jgi:transcription antitermination factor NusG